jgi:peroxiredoxin
MFRFLILLLLVPSLALAGDEPPQTTPEQATLIHVGDVAPTFEVEIVGGEVFDLAEQRGKVVLVNFWATWCPPCVAEMPHLRDEVLPLVGDDFVMVCVSREETNEVISAFAQKRRVSDLPMGGDVDRSIYKQYADHTIPRNFVVDRDGTVIFQSIGFEEPDFEKMIETIQSAIGHEAR